MDNNNNDDDGNRRSLMKNRTFWVSILTSIGALILAFLHLFSPNINIDGMTLGLLIVAMLPWLGPIFKSIELPGGIKLELREEIRQLDNKLTSQMREEGEKRREMAERVQQIEQIVFKGAQIAPNIQENITHTLEKFDIYLRSLGAEYEPFPKIFVRDDFPPGYQAHYDANSKELMISKDYVEDLDVIRREYCYHAFHQPLAQDMLGIQVGKAMVEGAAHGAGGVLSGFGFYFPCSFKKNPVFGMLNQPVLNESNLTYSYFKSEGTVNQSGVLRIIALGERWAHAFWEIRQKLDAEIFDRYLIEAWKAIPKTINTAHFDRIFVAELTKLVSSKQGADSDIFVRYTFKKWELED